MGLPPAQGHNNLRLTNTANMYQNHNFRLDTTQFTPIKTHHKPHTLLRPHPLKLPIDSRPLFSTSKRMPTISMPISILKQSSRQYPSRSQNIRQHVQFKPSQNTFNQRQTLYSYPKRTVLPTSFDSYQNIRPKKVRLQVPQSNYLPSMERRSNRNRSRKHGFVSNMPLINVNSSVLMVNHSPFGLRDPRFGIFHHCSQSISYY